ncbi:MAG: 5-carboxymethyl-2-hydroxymuconate Delta-isomerase [Gammaproteobacteria bacterium]|nr:5-carboxymethyl-2-hydroxymuconate Delta-isomerase [Gammaproteobacteria bacterium]MDH5777967.1 5-carboxymethyl-2-hydroxymuconate Delta-isomerase [Gammaproteobacteria bacterium]
MPHIIVEYAEGLLSDDQVPAVLQSIHQSVAQSGLFDASHIKTRAYPFRAFTQAGGSQPYIHIQARIKSGRDAENKKRLSETIVSGLQSLSLSPSVLTVEIMDMDRDSYGKIVFK